MCMERMKAFGAKCRTGRVAFTTPESQHVQDINGALGRFSPIYDSLQQCCDHANMKVSRVDAKHSDRLAYSFHEKTGLLKWLGPVYDANKSLEEANNQSSNSGSGESSRSSRGKGMSSGRAEQETQAETDAPEWVVADVLQGRDAGDSLKDVTFAENELPRYWIRPFGELLYRGKTPRAGSFGVAYVVSKTLNGTLAHHLQFGQVLGTEKGRYIFWAPHLGDTMHRPVRVLLSPSRFAPALVDKHLKMMLPKVKWAYDGTKHAEIQTLHPKTVKPTKKTSRETTVASTEETLSEKMKVRFARAAKTCQPHMDAEKLIEEMKSKLESERGKRKSLQKSHTIDASTLKSITDNETALRSRIGVIRNQVESTMKLLKNTNPTCSKDIQELLAQEEADRCRHDALDSIPIDDTAIRETIKRGKEWDARRAIKSLLFSYREKLDHSDPSNREVLREWEDNLKACSAKILAPSERNRPLPKSLVRSEMAAVSEGHGFSKAAEEKLLRDCQGVKSLKLVKALLQNKEHEHDIHEWEEIKQSLSAEKLERATRIGALQCEQTVDALVKSVQTKGCRDVLLEALRKIGTKTNRTDSANDLGELFSLKVVAAQKSGKIETMPSLKEALKNEKLLTCLSDLDLPDIDGHDSEKSSHQDREEPYSTDHTAFFKSCDHINDEYMETRIALIMQNSHAKKPEEKTALEELLKRLSDLQYSEVSKVSTCKAAAEKLLQRL